MWNEFKAFAFKGNLIDLAIGFILGVAATAVVTSLVDDILMPIVGVIVSDQDLTTLAVEVGGADIRYGAFLNRLVYFVIVAFILFLIIRGVNRVQRPFREDPAPSTKECPYCLSSIALQATRCPHCTSELDASPATAATAAG